MNNEFYNITVNAADGTSKQLETYQGDVLLLVNVASECGLTPQYEGLEALHRKYREQGLRVLGFPCNDFGGQEPGSMEQIQEFCKMKFGADFELLEKVKILGDDKHPLYTYLTTHSEPTGDVAWNFEKFLIARDGQIAARFNPRVTPEDADLIAAVERELAK